MLFNSCCLTALLALSAGCSHTIPSPYVQVAEPLDPAEVINWGEGILLSKLFPQFILHAQTSGQWLLLDWNGEAIYVRPKDEPTVLEFQPGTNKIDKLRIEGDVEILSLRRYMKCRKLNFDRSPPKLGGLSSPFLTCYNPLFAH